MASKTPNPAALVPKQLAAILSAAGDRAVTAKEISVAIERGAPTNNDGTIHFVHFAAWLCREFIASN